MIEKITARLCGMYLGIALGITGTSPTYSSALGSMPQQQQYNNPKAYDTPAETKKYTPINCDTNEQNLTYQYLMETDRYNGIGKLVRQYLDLKHNTRCTIEYFIDKKLPNGTGYITIFKKPIMTYGIHNR